MARERRVGSGATGGYPREVVTASAWIATATDSPRSKGVYDQLERRDHAAAVPLCTMPAILARDHPKRRSSLTRFRRATDRPFGGLGEVERRELGGQVRNHRGGLAAPATCTNSAAKPLLLAPGQAIESPGALQGRRPPPPQCDLEHVGAIRGAGRSSRRAPSPRPALAPRGMSARQLVGGSRHAPIKLSNWKTMISEPLPWFIFVLLYERPKKP